LRHLLDNCAPVRLAEHLTEYDVATAVGNGWDRKPDPELLDLMSGRFDALNGRQKNLAKQNRIAGRSFGVIVLRAKTNQLKHLLQLVPGLKAALDRISPGGTIEVAL
jgi:hypothetical protein